MTDGEHSCPSMSHQLGRAVGRKVRHFVLGFREVQYVSEEKKDLNWLLPVAGHIAKTVNQIKQQGANMSNQVDQLRTAIAANADAASSAAQRVLAKITELGDPDPDLTDDLQLLATTTAQLNSIASNDTPNPGDEDYVPSPVEPTPSQGEPTEDGTGGEPDASSQDDASDSVDDEAPKETEVGGVEVEDTAEDSGVANP